MSKPNILIQLDCDSDASVFDAVTAIDAGVNHLLTYAGVEPTKVRELVHGAIFTRGPSDLRHTAIFIGGSNVANGEALLRQACGCFIGPLRVSVMLDANGANTTAAAAVLAAAKHIPLAGAPAVVLGVTGPVGQRVARLLAREGARVKAVSRSLDRARAACEAVLAKHPQAELRPAAATCARETAAALAGARLVFAAGAAGVELVSGETREQARDARVFIDLNAVPPLGVGGLQAADKAVERDGAVCYGALGVGGMKMKIHRAVIQKLFEANNQVFDAEEIFALAQTLGL